MKFWLEPSGRMCYLGHVDTFEIVGVGPVSQEWLRTWTLWCRTCEALVVDVNQSGDFALLPRRKGVVGYVISVPMEMTIVGEPGERPAERVRSGVAELRPWDGVLPKKGEADEGS